MLKDEQTLSILGYFGLLNSLQKFKIEHKCRLLVSAVTLLRQQVAARFVFMSETLLNCSFN